jgi:glycosyltransferase involved in cell wall biosynthesis
MSRIEEVPQRDATGNGAPQPSRMRIAVIVNMVAPYTKPLFARLAEHDACDVLVVSETPMERDKRWHPETELPFEHVLLDSWTVDLAWLAVGSGFKRRYDAYLYVPKRPLAPLRRFAPDVVVAAGSGIWASPANIAALAARRWGDWAFVPWWGSFSREQPTLPRRLAEPWVRTFMRSADAWLAYGTRQARDLVGLGADPARTVIAPISAVVPDGSGDRQRTHAGGQTRYLFVGRLIETKGLEVLLDAFRRVEGGELWIAGDGPLREAMESAAARDPRIRLLGYVDSAALADVYGQVDVLVLPSLFEAWGLVVHEALAHGVPVIASDQVGAADDLIEPGANGYVVRAGAAEELAEAMGAVARWKPVQWKRAAKRSEERIAACTVERAADGFVHGCAVAIEHRKRRERTDATG